MIIFWVWAVGWLLSVAGMLMFLRSFIDDLTWKEAILLMMTMVSWPVTIPGFLTIWTWTWILNIVAQRRSEAQCSPSS